MRIRLLHAVKEFVNAIEKHHDLDERDECEPSQQNIEHDEDDDEDIDRLHGLKAKI